MSDSNSLPSISPNVIIMTRDELDILLEKAFTKGVKRGHTADVQTERKESAESAEAVNKVMSGWTVGGGKHDDQAWRGKEL